MERGPFPLYIGFVPSRKAWDKFIKSAGRDDEYDVKHGQCNFFESTDLGRSVVLICVNPDNKVGRLEIIGIIAHEVVHAFDYLCQFIGEKSPSKEFKAYTIQSWVQEACWAYEELVGFNE